MPVACPFPYRVQIMDDFLPRQSGKDSLQAGQDQVIGFATAHGATSGQVNAGRKALTELGVISSREPGSGAPCARWSRSAAPDEVLSSVPATHNGRSELSPKQPPDTISLKLECMNGFHQIGITSERGN